MAICQNIVLIFITTLVIYLSYLFTPPTNYAPIEYVPKCIHLNDLTHFLCAFSYKIGAPSFSVIQKGASK